MSAFEVRDEHIEAIITWAQARHHLYGTLRLPMNINPIIDEQVIADILRQQNARSVAHRYNNGTWPRLPSSCGPGANALKRFRRPRC